jgi:predicted amidophosphoribosyltransferase
MANFCLNCGKKLSFLERHDNDALCGACSANLTNARRSQLANLEQSIASSKTATPEQLTQLKTYDRKTVLDLYYRLYNTFVTDKELDERDIATLNERSAGRRTDQPRSAL